MGAAEGGRPGCPSCGADDPAACGCLDHGALLSFLVEFNKAAGEPPPALPPTPSRLRAAAPVGSSTPGRPGSTEPGSDGGSDFESAAARPLPVWPPPPDPAPLRSETVSREPPPRRGFLRRGRR